MGRIANDNLRRIRAIMRSSANLDMVSILFNYLVSTCQKETFLSVYIIEHLKDAFYGLLSFDLQDWRRILEKPLIDFLLKRMTYAQPGLFSLENWVPSVKS